MTSLLMSEDHRTRTLMSPALFLIAKERPKAEVAWSNASPFLCEFFDPGTQLANKFGDLIVAIPNALSAADHPQHLAFDGRASAQRGIMPIALCCSHLTCL